MPASFVVGKYGEKAWKRAKDLVDNEYGAELEESDPEKYYALVATIYKNICKSPKHDCAVKGEKKESELISIGNLIEKANDRNAMVDSIVNQLKTSGIKKINKSGNEIYIESGDNEASISIDENRNKSKVRIIIYKDMEIDGKKIASFLKKYGI